MATSTMSSTPYARRPESRASAATDLSRAEWRPVVGAGIRVSGNGNEGILRYLGETEFREGIWAGIELTAGFVGMGKNDGSVDG